MGISRKKIKRGIILSVSISILTLVFVLLFTHSELTFQALKQIEEDYLVLAAVMTITFWLLRALKLQVLTHALGFRILLYRVFAIYLASVFVSHITPSSIGGLPFLVYFLHQEGIPLGKTTAITVLDGMLTFIIFMFSTPIFLLLWGDYLNLGPKITVFFYLAVLLFIIFMVISLIVIFHVQIALVVIEWIIKLRVIKKLLSQRSLLRFRKLLKREITYFNEGIRLLINSKRDLLLMIIYSLLYWLLFLGLAPVILLGLGVKVPIPPVILAQLIFNFIQPIIPTPGSSGGAELGFAYLFKFMVPGYLLGIFVVIWRFFMFYSSLIIGGILFIQLVRDSDYLNNG